MKANYKYNEFEYSTEAELLEKHDNIHSKGWEPIMETYIEKIEEKYIDDYDEIEKVRTTEVEKERQIGITYIYVDMDQDHINYLERSKLNQEIADINQWYRDHDYYINKVLLGEWEEIDQRYIDYKAERLLKQKRYDEIKVELLTLQ